MADTSTPAELRARARQIRDACDTFGNRLAGTTESCAAAADELEKLAVKLEATPTTGVQRAADRVLGRIGDGRDLAAGTTLGALADDIVASAKVTGTGLGVVALVGVGIFLALKFSR